MDIVRSGTHIENISPQDKRALVKTGAKSLDTNPFFQFIDIIMNDQNTRKYFDQFFSDWDDIKTTVMVMKTYQVIDDELKRLELIGKVKMIPEIRRKFMIGLIKEMMTNADCRKELVYNMNEFMGGSYKNCRKLVENRSTVSNDIEGETVLIDNTPETYK